MNSFSTKISSVALSLLILFSTFSLTIEKHFCEGFLVAISYFGNSEGCSDEEEDCDSPSVIASENCCTDEIQQVQGQEELQSPSTEDFSLEKQQFVVAFLHSFNNLFTIPEKQIIPFQKYSPPNFVEDIQVLHQVYII